MRHLTRRNPAADQSLDDIFAQDFEFEDDPGASDFGSDFEDDPVFAEEDDEITELTPEELAAAMAEPDVQIDMPTQGVPAAPPGFFEDIASNTPPKDGFFDDLFPTLPTAEEVAAATNAALEAADIAAREQASRQQGTATPATPATPVAPSAKAATTTIGNSNNQQSGTSSALAAIMGGLFVGAAVVVGMRGYREMKNRR